MKRHPFELILADYNTELCNRFKESFNGFDNVKVYNGDIFNVESTLVVSAANSFGLMDGGVDGAITMHFGNQLMERVQAHIIEHYSGEQPVGSSFIIKAKNYIPGERIQYIAHTPTMRVPKDIRPTENVYVAMKAILEAVNHHNDSVVNNKFDTEETYIATVVCCGLGTFCGKVEPKRAANEMALAYHNFLYPPKRIDWDFANQRNNEVFVVKMN